MNDRLDFPMDHPSYAGMLAPENTRIRERLDRHDVVLLAGVRAFVPHHYSPEPAVGPDTRLVQVDDDPADDRPQLPRRGGPGRRLRAILARSVSGERGPARRRSVARRRPGDPRGAAVLRRAAAPAPRRQHRRRPPAPRRGARGGGDHHRPAAARAPDPLRAGLLPAHRRWRTRLGHRRRRRHLARPPGPPRRRRARRRLRDVRPPGTLDRGPRTGAGDLRGVQQRRVPHPQADPRPDARQPRRRLRRHGLRPSPDQLARAWPRRSASPAYASRTPTSSPPCSRAALAEDPPLLVEVPVEPFGPEG